MAAGRKTGGRAKGTPNKTTALLKDAILSAAENVGNELRDGGGKTAYLEFLAKDQPAAFSTLLGKVMPMQVDASVDGEIRVTIRDMTKDD